MIGAYGYWRVRRWRFRNLAFVGVGHLCYEQRRFKRISCPFFLEIWLSGRVSFLFCILKMVRKNRPANPRWCPPPPKGRPKVSACRSSRAAAAMRPTPPQPQPASALRYFCTLNQPLGPPLHPPQPCHTCEHGCQPFEKKSQGGKQQQLSASPAWLFLRSNHYF